MNKARGVKFPSMHIASSVTNRILNVYDQLRASESPTRGEPGTAAVAPPPAPAVPDTEQAGTAIEAVLASSTPAAPELGEPSGDAAMAVGSVLEGGSALEGLLERQTRGAP